MKKPETIPDPASTDWFFFRQRSNLTFEQAPHQLEMLTGVTPEDWQSRPQTLRERVHEADADLLEAQIQLSATRPEGTRTTFRLRHAVTGRIVHIAEFRRAIANSGGIVTGYDGMWLDVTRQAVLERRLLSAVWKENLAVVTRGFAHDFNNMLAGILSLSEFLLGQVDRAHPFREGLTLLKANALQATQQVGRLVQLEQASPGACNFQDLTELTRDSVNHLPKSILRRVQVVTEFAPEVLPVYVDAAGFRQALLSLIFNAVEAMSDGGRLTLTTERQASPGPLPVAPAVSLTVGDTGGGIDPALLNFICDPDRTTKPANRGSGLGLMMVSRFAREHRGRVVIESDPKRGTAVRLWLPEANLDATEPSRGGNGQGRRVLLVGEPTKALRHAAQLLEDLSCQVVPCRREAPRTLTAQDERFDLLFLQVEQMDAATRALIGTVRSQKLAPVIVLQTAGAEDQIAPETIAQVNLILTADASDEVFTRQVAGVLSSNFPGAH